MQGLQKDEENSESSLLRSIQIAWQDELKCNNRMFELRESSLDRSCLDYLFQEVSQISEQMRLQHLTIYLDDIGNLHQNPLPSAPGLPPEPEVSSPATVSRNEAFSDDLISSFVECNKLSLRSLTISAKNKILGDSHRRDPSKFVRILLQMQKLEKFVLAYFDLRPLHAALVFWDFFASSLPVPDGVMECTALNHLVLDRCLFDLTSIQMLSSGLRAYENLKTLEMNHCCLDDTSLNPLFASLQETKSRLCRICFSNNDITEISLPAITTLVTHQTALTILHLENNPHFFPALGNAAQQNEVVTGPRMPEPNQDSDANEANDDQHHLRVLNVFVQAVAHHITLHELSLANCGVTAESLFPLMRALAESNVTCLKNLLLKQNSNLRLGDWVEFLPPLRNLKVLNLEEVPLVPNRLTETHASIVSLLRKFDQNLSLVDFSITDYLGRSTALFLMQPAIRPIVVRNHYLWRIKDLLCQVGHKPDNIVPVALCPHILARLMQIPGRYTVAYFFLRSDFVINMIKKHHHQIHKRKLAMPVAT